MLGKLPRDPVLGKLPRDPVLGKLPGDPIYYFQSEHALKEGLVDSGIYSEINTQFQQRQSLCDK